MNYDHFEKLLTTEITEKFDEAYSVHICTIPKNNGIRRRAIALHDQEGIPFPLQYLDTYYHMWETGVSIRHVANLFVNDYKRCMSVRRRLPEHFFQNYDEIRHNLRCRLINASKNMEFLQQVPYQKWMDLAITCVYEMDVDDFQDCTIQIRNEHLETWGIRPEQVMQDAMHSMTQKSDVIFQPLIRILEEEMDMPGEELPDSPLYLLTNEDRTHGAVNIVLPGMTEKIAQKLGQDYYIIPSSIHECLILPDDGSYSAAELNAMVCSINRTNVEEQDVLSDHVYIYKKPEARVMHR